MNANALPQNLTAETLQPPLSLSERVRRIVPKHPVPMTTVFNTCFIVNFAMEPDVLNRHLPEPIEADTHHGNAYISIIIANMDRMRPAFLPRMFGVTYNQIVYRAVVRVGDERGVYFLRSDADHPLMSLAGNWLTFFRFNHTPMTFEGEADRYHLHLEAKPNHHANIHAEYRLLPETDGMPDSSAFTSRAEAKVALVELFQAFAYDVRTGRLDRVRIKRDEWELVLVDDTKAQYDFMNGSAIFPASSTWLDSIFCVENLNYYWGVLNRDV